PITQKDKIILCAHQKSRELWREYLKDTRRIKIDPPYQKGWIRLFELTPAAKNRKDVKDLEKILERINTEVVCRRKDFVIRCRKTKKWITQRQGLSRISLANLRRKPFPEKLLKYFVFYPNYRWPWSSFYQFKFPFLFELVIHPNMIDCIKTHNIDTKAELDRLDQWLNASTQQKRYEKLRGRTRSWERYPRKAQLDRLRAKQKLRKFLLEGEEADQAIWLTMFSDQPLFRLFYLRNLNSPREKTVC
ncbi:MAG: hypothetical protein AAF571_12475, partial [Verrucomicrobiota bacterium]